MGTGYVYQPQTVRPTYAPVRPTANDINSAPRVVHRGDIISGDGATIPIIYGRCSVNGYVYFAKVSGGYLIMGVAWGYGPIAAVESIWFGDEAPPSGVEVRHYLGSLTQGVDSWIEAVQTGYNDTLVLSTDAGDIPIAHSVLRIATSAISSVPRPRGIILGRLVEDPNAAENSDPYFDQNVIDVDFESGGTDSSQYAHTISLQGTASIDSGGLQLSGGSGDYATVAYDAIFNPGTGLLCFELVATSDTIATGVATLIANDATGSAKSIQIDRNGDSLEAYISSDGSTWDIANAVDVGTITTSRFSLTMERLANELVFYLNGEETARLYTEDAIFDSGEDWEIGAFNATQLWEGAVHAWRYCIGVYRYGSDHDATATPFADSDSYGTRTVYSDNFALFWNDYVSSPIYGMGATTENVSESALWAATTLAESCDNATRGTGGIVIPSTRKTEYWADLLAEYADCICFPYGSNYRIQKDDKIGPTNPSGQDVCEDGDFDSASAWTLGDGWAIGSGVATVDGTQSAESLLSQELITEAGVEYSLSFEITAISAGEISVEVAGVEFIAAQTEEGVYSVLFTAPATTTQLDIIADADAVATIDDVMVRRSHWLETRFVEGSMAMAGAPSRDTPTSVKINYTVPSDTSPNWETLPVERTKPDAETGVAPFVQSIVDMPGFYQAGQALNRAKRRVERMNDRITTSYITTDHGIKHKIGDAIQAVNAYRGVDTPLWVEAVEMVDYGRYRVSGSRYSELYFSDTCEVCDCLLPEENQTIVATLLYSEEAGSIGSGGPWGTLATDGAGRIIANPTGRKIIVSEDYGETWTEYSSALPTSIANNNGTGLLYPTRWQYWDGVWRAPLRDSGSANDHAYASSFSGGSFTVGQFPDDRGGANTDVGLRNGRYSSSSMAWEDGGLVVAGRWGYDNLYPGANPGLNYLVVARYTGEYGDDVVPSTYYSGWNDDNAYGLEPLADGYFLSRWDGGRMWGTWVAADLSSIVNGGNSNWSVSVVKTNAVGNGIDTVLMPNTRSSCYRWYKAVGASLETINPNTGETGTTGAASAGWSGTYWLYVTGQALNNKLFTSHSENPEADDTFTRGPQVTLPDTISSSGSDAASQNIFYLGNNQWVGYYIRTGDRKVDIYKFTYGDCDC